MKVLKLLCGGYGLKIGKRTKLICRGYTFEVPDKEAERLILSGAAEPVEKPEPVRENKEVAEPAASGSKNEGKKTAGSAQKKKKDKHQQMPEFTVEGVVS